MPAALASAFFMLGCSVVVSTEFGPAQALILLIFGGVYGLAVRAVMGLIPVARWGYLWTGLIAGPIPGVIVLSLRHRNWADNDDRGGAWLFTIVLGMLIGLVEWAAESRRE
jgi:hypothetical protein